MNFAMWHKAVTVIPSVSKEEWRGLDLVSKWLISTRAAVLVMTFISAALAGLFAWRNNAFNPFSWLALTLGLMFAHASHNLFNDYTDFVRGVDRKNYYRAVYGIQPLVHGFMTKGQHLSYFAFSGLLAFICGIYLVWRNDFDMVVWTLLVSGSFFLLFYTWPLKYIALGEIAVFLVWGPLMVGGGYYVIAHRWDWDAILIGAIYALGVTTVLFGKHIDKIKVDREKKIYTLPVILGEKISRYIVIAMMILPYLLVVHLIANKSFSPVILVTLLAIPRMRQVMPAFFRPKPIERPENFPEGQGGWPLYFAPLAFWYNRRYGTLLVLGLVVDVLVRIYLPFFWH